MTLCFVLERRWPVEQAIRLRRTAADAFTGWPWLSPPHSMGEVTAIDLSRALSAGDGARTVDLTRRWVDGAWKAWATHHPVVRTRTDWLARKLD